LRERNPIEEGDGRRVQLPRLQRAVSLGIVCAVLLAGQSRVARAGESTANGAQDGTPLVGAAHIDSSRPYSLTELIDIAAVSNPRTQIFRERAAQGARRLGIARSEFFPALNLGGTAQAAQVIIPFPRVLAPAGFVVAQIPGVGPQASLDYAVFDLARSARVDEASAGAEAAGARFRREDQEVAFNVATAFYNLVTQQEALEAARQTLDTSRITEEAVEAQLAHGRATEPDVLNARAAAAQASFDLQSAMGNEMIARIALRDAIGAEPSPAIHIERPRDTDLPREVTASVESLIGRALLDRPDLQATIAGLRGYEAGSREAKAAYAPTLALSASVGPTWEWPSADGQFLGPAFAWQWTASLDVHWLLLDGGARRNRVEEAESKVRESQGEVREEHDRVVREVWTAYVAFLTALRKEEASVALLDAADASYASSLDAYKFGVRNEVDVVTSQRQLAQARYARVAARSEVFVDAMNLELVTGNVPGRAGPVTSAGTEGGAAR
jgi:outer membrane protein TolC